MFKLDPRIEKDSTFIKDLPLCQVRLQNDSRYPWLVLLPRENGLTEVYELSSDQQAQLMVESSLVSKALAKSTECKKINVANLGNVVSQLHWHVVARFENDLTWPAPIWGVGTSVPWQDQKRAEFIDSFLTNLAELFN
ncbi:HIT domain-containing protein [uncultured Psychrosphaera sp.]|uniref:HIT domain-containing protein n=1 Tax=uncultured Psychrosphaera sp. TaxID=1403522 RepID=UPI00261551D8|nr:HIT domain-containing protein [uncultured Psychrosphaera sp.]